MARHDVAAGDERGLQDLGDVLSSVRGHEQRFGARVDVAGVR